MLILTRRVKEAIMIGDSIAVTVLEIQGDKVVLGVEAPRAVPVHRREVYAAIQAENRRAARSLDTIDVGSMSRLLKDRQNREKTGEREE